jgi:hypothetical protein
MVVFGACSAQRAEAQSTNFEQKIIGTWFEQGREETWVFNANGTFIRGSSSELKFGVTSTQVYISSFNVFNISMSSDGRTLILTAFDGRNCYWLTKK